MSAGKGAVPGVAEPAGMSRAWRVVSYVALGVLAAPVGGAGALVQDGWFPGGLLLALAGVAGLFYGGVKLTGTRLGVVAPGAVWLATVMLLSSARPEGDFLFAAGIGPYIYLLGGVLVGVVCSILPLLPSSGANAARLGG
ncbi:DUF6113 family protein [Streptomyces sp. SPB162]|uniref:DUF6113 family protein n=1 Tax=Streptomyces sp. SPB162 TaxID=2940560 RepID=UPI0024063222|nr:DUF6113 family protein [Streptomyces sp. SPB162]MDF9815429.1 hypothetical protein [Streptomyces sp. SPB162]